MFLCKIKFTTSNETTPRSIHSHALQVHLPLGNLILGAKVGFFSVQTILWTDSIISLYNPKGG